MPAATATGAFFIGLLALVSAGILAMAVLVVVKLFRGQS